MLQLGPDYYYSNAIGLSADNSSSNKAIRIDNWRPDIGPRVINVEKETYRYLIGIRGSTDSGWDWELHIYIQKLKLMMLLTTDFQIITSSGFE